MARQWATVSWPATVVRSGWCCRPRPNCWSPAANTRSPIDRIEQVPGSGPMAVFAFEWWWCPGADVKQRLRLSYQSDVDSGLVSSRRSRHRGWAVALAVRKFERAAGGFVAAVVAVAAAAVVVDRILAAVLFVAAIAGVVVVAMV